MRRALIVIALLLATPIQAEDLRIIAYETESFFYRDEAGPAGLEKEILDYFGRATGRQLTIEFVGSFSDLIRRIEAGEADIAAGTITVTEERSERVDFSESYFPVRAMLIEPREHVSGSLAELAGSTIVTISGTTTEALLRDVPGANFLYVENQRELFEMVADGRARATAVDTAVAFALLAQFPSLHLSLPLGQPEHYGFAMANNSELVDELNQTIRQLKASGIYFRLLREYLGDEAVGTVRAASD